MQHVHPRIVEAALVTAFVLAMAAANLSIAVFGPWFLPVTAFFAVGVVLVSRDYLHDVWRDRFGGGFWPRMIAMIVAAAGISFAVDSSAARIAIASVCALVGTALAETFIFQGAFNRPWMQRSNLSNVGGAFADSLIFPVVAFGFGFEGLLLLVVTQAAMKAAGGLFWSSVARFTLNPDRRRARRRRQLELTGQAPA